jgi:hypothetical protein
MTTPERPALDGGRGLGTASSSTACPIGSRPSGNRTRRSSSEEAWPTVPFWPRGDGRLAPFGGNRRCRRARADRDSGGRGPAVHNPRRHISARPLSPNSIHPRAAHRPPAEGATSERNLPDGQAKRPILPRAGRCSWRRRIPTSDQCNSYGRTRFTSGRDKMPAKKAFLVSLGEFWPADSAAGP